VPPATSPFPNLSQAYRWDRPIGERLAQHRARATEAEERRNRNYIVSGLTLRSMPSKLAVRVFEACAVALLMLAPISHGALAQSAPGGDDADVPSETQPADQAAPASDQAVTATRLGPISESPLFGFHGVPTLPRDNPRDPQTYDQVPSPIGVPLFDGIDRMLGGTNYYTMQMTIPRGRPIYAFNCPTGQCQGSAADVWAAMPASQQELYLSALLDVYEPLAETVNRPVLNQRDGNGPSRHAEIWIQPSDDLQTVLTAAKIDVDASGALTKWFIGGPHSAAEIGPPDRTVVQQGQRVTIPGQRLPDWAPHLMD
jgi:hypothetical protein